MIVKVDEDECIGCGVCEDECPEIFKVNSVSISEVIRQPEEDEEECVEAAIDACPVGAISAE